MRPSSLLNNGGNNNRPKTPPSGGAGGPLSNGKVVSFAPAVAFPSSSGATAAKPTLARFDSAPAAVSPAKQERRRASMGGFSSTLNDSTAFLGPNNGKEQAAMRFKRRASATAKLETTTFRRKPKESARWRTSLLVSSNSPRSGASVASLDGKATRQMIMEKLASSAAMGLFIIIACVVLGYVMRLTTGIGKRRDFGLIAYFLNQVYIVYVFLAGFKVPFGELLQRMDTFSKLTLASQVVPILYYIVFWSSKLSFASGAVLILALQLGAKLGLMLSHEKSVDLVF